MDRQSLKEIVITQQERAIPRDTYVERVQYQQLINNLSLPHALVVMGIRRCGKSTVLNQLLQQHYPHQFYYLNFEDERLLQFTVADFNILQEVFIELFGERKIFYFDEIQNIPQWEMYVRRMQDSGYKFFLTGSNASLLSKEMGTKLTGRHVDIELFPFSFREYLLFHQQEKPQDFHHVKTRGNLHKFFNQYLQQGGMPEYLQYLRPTLLTQIYEDILFRDIVTRHDIKDIKSLRELSLYLMTNLAKPFSYTKLKNTLGLGSVNTVKNYIEYLEQSYLLFTINQFSYSLHQQMVTNKKAYAIDNGLANAIAFQFSKNQGQYLENLIFLELRRHHKQIYYYKTSNDLEVDFALLRGNKIEQLIQVSSDITDPKTKKREIAALLKALEETQLDEGLLLTEHDQDRLTFGDKTILIKPAYQWLLE